MFAIALMLAAPLPAPARSPLDGVWRTGCLPIGKNGRHGMITTLTIAGKRMTASAQIYGHNTCDIPTIRTEYRGAIVHTEPAEGGVAFDHDVKAVEMTIGLAEVVDVYNKPGSGCGFGRGWVIGKPRSVAGATCAPWTFPTVGTHLYERAWISGDSMKIGSMPVAWGNTAPDKRPAVPGMLAFTRVMPAK